MTTVQQLQDGHKDARLRLSDALDHYSAVRSSLMAQMVNSGRPEKDADQLLDAFESLWVPTFSTGSSRAVPNAMARREYDSALRAAVGPENFDRFTGALLDYRRSQQTAADINERLYKAGGVELYESSEAEAATLTDMRKDIVRTVRQMNPTADIRVFLQGMERSGPGIELDPVRKTMAIALDAGNFDPDDAVNQSVFVSLTHVLTQKERQILDEAFSTFDQVSLDNGKTWRKLDAGEKIEPIDGDPSSGMMRLSDARGNNIGIVAHRRVQLETEQTAQRAAQAFVRYRKGASKPPQLIERALQPFTNFFERVGNLARGRGFQNVEDIYRKIEQGKLGGRAELQAKLPGVRLPLPGDNKDLYDRARNSIGKMTGFELAASIREQQVQLREKRKEMKSFRRQLFAYSSLARGLAKTRDYLSTKGQDALTADMREMNELQRGLAALKAEQRRRSGETVANGLGVPPQPPGQRYSDVVAEALSREMSGQSETIRIDGRYAQYEVEAGREGQEWPINVGLKPHTGEDAVQIGMAATTGGAAALINAFEQIGTGAVSTEANNLAVMASRAGTDGNADIRTILQSGLVEPGLNEAISRRDVMAFVYPLKTGDVIFQTDDGRWLAARSENFLKLVSQVPDPHLSAAGEVIRDNVVQLQKAASGPRTRDLDTGEGTKNTVASDMAPLNRQDNGPLQPDPAGPAQAMAASIGAKVHSIGENREEVAKLKDVLSGYSDEQLKASLRLTQEARQKIQPDAPKMDLQEKRNLGRAENAMLEVMRSRGMDTKPFEGPVIRTGSRSQGSQGPKM